jgi:hypothetical protein
MEPGNPGPYEEKALKIAKRLLGVSVIRTSCFEKVYFFSQVHSYKRIYN